MRHGVAQFADNALTVSGNDNFLASRLAAKLFPIFIRQGAHRGWARAIVSPFSDTVVAYLKAFVVSLALGLATAECRYVNGVRE